MDSFADVTVVMPALNRESLISRALESASAQELPPRQVIVVDDGSTDRTAEVARRSGAHVLSMPKRSGSGPARNAGIEAATTEWVAFLDSDDEWWPQHLGTALAHSGDHSMVAMAAVATSGRWQGSPRPGARIIGPADMLVPSALVVTSGTLVRRKALMRAGGFRALPRAQDLDLWLRVLEQGSGVTVGEATLTYHEHETQAIKDVDLMRTSFERILADHRGRPWMSPALHDAAMARVVWDDFRGALRRSERREALRHAGWIAARPAALGGLLKVLQQRRRARSRSAAPQP